MSLVRNNDYYKENRKFKRTKIVMKKTKFSKSMKTQTCSLSRKDNPCLPAQYKVRLGNEVRSLCLEHFKQHTKKDEEHEVIFVKAINL